MSSKDPQAGGDARSGTPDGSPEQSAGSEGSGGSWIRVGIATAVVGLIVVAWLASGSAADNGDASAPDQARESAADTTEAVNLAPLGHDLGAEGDAAVFIIEFSDFGCVHCQRFHQESFPTLHEEFIETGEVAWKYIPVTVGGFPNTQEVTEAAECAAEQGAFFDLADRIFHSPDTWTHAEDPHSVVDEWAEEEGLDMEAYRACVREGATRERVREYTETARDLGLRATPTFVVNGQPVQGAPPLEAFRDFIQQELDRRPDPPDG